MACEDIGTYSGQHSDFVKFVIQTDPEGTCQYETVGVNSPGAVQQAEVVTRFVFSPTHSPNGPIDESVVSDAFSIGCSVKRLPEQAGDHISALHQQGESQAKAIRAGLNGRPPQPNRRYVGVLRFAVSETRALAVDALRNRVRIYDTALPNDSLHADMVANSDGLSRELKKALRVLMYLHAHSRGLSLSPHLDKSVDVNALSISLTPA